MKPRKSELKFEKELIAYLENLGGVKQWEYLPNVKTTNGLWRNFKKILESNNKHTLDKELSVTEFNQVIKRVTDLKTPFEAGQFLYGVNGVSEIEIDLDNGKHIFLKVFNQANIGAGSTVYQIVNQIERKKIIDGKPNRRFDVTLLINGLPIIQIELKTVGHSVNESFNQMKQYISEKQFDDIYSTLQILVGMTPNEIKYMANAKLNDFSRDFAFDWQSEHKIVNSWRKFSDEVLSIPMAHNLATRYMVLDGTKNKESIKVMRPYQVRATKNALDKINKHDFKHDGKLGYIWHTTGSGKTITSFKTAWLASKMSHVDKVVFLVDRIALTNQTSDAYRAYDPIISNNGVVVDTANVSDLIDKLKSKSDKNIIVTSIQKMSRCVDRMDCDSLKKNILFIVDEAHRSTSGEKETEGMFARIRNKIPTSAWVGYTGTPNFKKNKITTEAIFGELLHAYTIKEAIVDNNVLGFNVEFKETIKAPKDPSAEDIDDNMKASVYDNHPDHVNLVVKDIFKNWQTRSSNYKYNALLTVHVGGGKASTPRAMEYYYKMLEENQKYPDDKQIKVAVSFSMDTSNRDNQLSTNKNLEKAIKQYNQQFNTNYDLTTTKEYKEDLVRRLNKTSDDQNYLDLVIVVDQLLTGFDAPQLNTLYVDRTLKGGNLIQAYSRTNRIHNNIYKPHGNIINYRWPTQNEEEMNDSLAIYSDISSADKQLSLIESGILIKNFKEVKENAKEIVENLSKLTDEFTKVPDSEREQKEVYEQLKKYNAIINKLKQYSEDEHGEPISAYDDREGFYKIIGIGEEEEIYLTTVIANRIKEKISEDEDIDISQVDLQMEHISEVRINYDYLSELIKKMANSIHDNKTKEVETIKKEIEKEIEKSDNFNLKTKISNFIEKIISGKYTFESYPVNEAKENIYQTIYQEHTNDNMKQIEKFIKQWDLAINVDLLYKLISKHRYGNREDLNKQDELNELINHSKNNFQSSTGENLKKLTWIQYRIKVRESMYELADKIKKEE
ncbi:MAG: type I restriction endonuclease subunit R [Bacilli bacterium]